jgi:hypothetical protein
MYKKRQLVDEYRFPGFCPETGTIGEFGDPKARIIRLKRTQKKQSVDVVEKRTGVITTRRYDESGIYHVGMQEYIWRWKSVGYCARGAGATGLAGRQSFLHKTICLLCRAEVPHDDGKRRCEGTEAGLAYSEGIGQRIHAEAASTESYRSAWGSRYRRKIFTERTYVADCCQRFGEGTTDLVWGREPFRGESGYVL